MPANIETMLLTPTFDEIAVLKQSVPSPDVKVLNKSISDTAQEKLVSIASQKWESDQENAFFVGDLGEVFRQHLRWKSLLPRIEPFYGKFFFQEKGKNKKLTFFV